MLVLVLVLVRVLVLVLELALPSVLVLPPVLVLLPRPQTKVHPTSWRVVMLLVYSGRQQGLPV